jgi:hypothetical protein
MRLKIITRYQEANGEGAPITTVVDADTGESLAGVTLVEFVHKCGDVPRARIEVLFPEVECEADAEYVKIGVFTPEGGAYRHVRLATQQQGGG